MNITLGLFALSMLGAEGPGPQETYPIAYEVRFLKMNGLEWRGTFYSHLQPVATQGGTTVWTSDRETTRKLAETDSRVTKAPRVNAMPRSPVTIVDRASRKVASGVTRLADGPFDHATRVAYTPNYQVLSEGSMITMSGRKLDQGILACVVIDETRVAAVHHVTLTETVGAKGCCEAACDKIAPRLDVPEIAHASVEGEWLIPNGGALVVSLGAHTAADETGKAVVSERLVVIEARLVGDDTSNQANLTHESSLDPRPHAKPAAAPGVPMPMPMPAMPSRSMPQARAADGSPMPLPPLPEAPPAPSSLPGTSEPCASPQMPHPKAEPATQDAASTQAGLISRSIDQVNVARSGSIGQPRRFLLPLLLNAGNMDLDIELRMAMPPVKAVTPPCPAPED